MILKINDIIPDSEINQRVEGIDLMFVAEYAEAMERGDKFPPIKACYDGEKYFVWDGFHRVEAAKLASIGTVEVDVQEGTRDDAIELACSANADLGNHRSNATKRRQVETMLRRKSDWSDRQLARWCKVSHEFVRKLRGGFHTVNVDSMNQRTFVHHKTGKPAQMDTANIGRTSGTSGALDVGEYDESIRAAIGKAPCEFRDQIWKVVTTRKKPLRPLQVNTLAWMALRNPQEANEAIDYLLAHPEESGIIGTDDNGDCEAESIVEAIAHAKKEAKASVEMRFGDLIMQASRLFVAYERFTLDYPVALVAEHIEKEKHIGFQLTHAIENSEDVIWYFKELLKALGMPLIESASENGDAEVKP